MKVNNSVNKFYLQNAPARLINRGMRYVQTIQTAQGENPPKFWDIGKTLLLAGYSRGQVR